MNRRRLLTFIGAAPLAVAAGVPVVRLLTGGAGFGTSAVAGDAFAAAVRNALRSDPDVLWVREVRCAETVSACLQTALRAPGVTTNVHNAMPSLTSLGRSPLAERSLAERFGVFCRRLFDPAHQASSEAVPERGPKDGESDVF